MKNETIAKNQAEEDFCGIGFIGDMINSTNDDIFEFEIIYIGNPGTWSCIYGPECIFNNDMEIEGYKKDTYECYAS